MSNLQHHAHAHAHTPAEGGERSEVEEGKECHFAAEVMFGKHCRKSLGSIPSIITLSLQVEGDVKVE